jgi:hypothetical protein
MSRSHRSPRSPKPDSMSRMEVLRYKMAKLVDKLANLTLSDDYDQPVLNTTQWVQLLRAKKIRDAQVALPSDTEIKRVRDEYESRITRFEAKLELKAVPKVNGVYTPDEKTEAKELAAQRLLVQEIKNTKLSISRYNSELDTKRELAADQKSLAEAAGQLSVDQNEIDQGAEFIRIFDQLKQVFKDITDELAYGLAEVNRKVADKKIAEPESFAGDEMMPAMAVLFPPEMEKLEKLRKNLALMMKPLEESLAERNDLGEGAFLGPLDSLDRAAKFALDKDAAEKRREAKPVEPCDLGKKYMLDAEMLDRDAIVNLKLIKQEVKRLKADGAVKNKIAITNLEAFKVEELRRASREVLEADTVNVRYKRAKKVNVPDPILVTKIHKTLQTKSQDERDVQQLSRDCDAYMQHVANELQKKFRSAKLESKLLPADAKAELAKPIRGGYRAKRAAKKAVDAKVALVLAKELMKPELDHLIAHQGKSVRLLVNKYKIALKLQQGLNRADVPAQQKKSEFTALIKKKVIAKVLSQKRNKISFGSHGASLLKRSKKRSQESKKLLKERMKEIQKVAEMQAKKKERLVKEARAAELAAKSKTKKSATSPVAAKSKHSPKTSPLQSYSLMNEGSRKLRRAGSPPSMDSESLRYKRRKYGSSDS